MATTSTGNWFTRCATTAQDWLLDHPGDALPPEVLDAVVAAGGVPVRNETSSRSDPSEAFYLHPKDSEFVTELRAAGMDGHGR